MGKCFTVIVAAAAALSFSGAGNPITMRNCSSVRTCPSFMSITIASMIESLCRRAAYQPPNHLIQPPARLTPRWNQELAPGSYLVAKDCRFQGPKNSSSM